MTGIMPLKEEVLGSLLSLSFCLVRTEKVALSKAGGEPSPEPDQVGTYIPNPQPP